MISFPSVVFRLRSIPQLFVFFYVAQSGGHRLSAEPPPESARGGQPFVESYLRDRLAFWQGRLKLDDWSVKLVISAPADLRPGTLGNINWDAGKKTAMIKVLTAASRESSSHDVLQEMEFTVLHELIHLELAQLPRTEQSRSAEEFAVNHLAEALLQTERPADPAVQVTR